ncbi:MAG TPA: redoxin family protein [bacterium]|nr:redoxin family protein [bacterium]
MVQMRDSIDHFHSMDARVVVVARHDAAPMRAFWKEHKLPFIGIPDPQGTIGKQYRQQWKPWRLGLMPALFIVDRDGLIAHAHYSKGMSDIPSNEALFSELRQLKR